MWSLYTPDHPVRQLANVTTAAQAVYSRILITSKPVLLMPGFDGTGTLFRPLSLALPQKFDVRALRYSGERVFDDYVTTVKAQLSSQPAILVAESFSGPIAMALMARYPSNIQCVVLCATFVESPFLALTRLARLVPTFVFGMHIGQRAMLRRYCLDEGCDPVLMEQALAVIRSVPSATVAARLQVLARLQVRALCRQIFTPTLILRAMSDRLVSPSRYKQLIEELPGASVREVEGPHLLLQARPKECARMICEFIDQTSHH